MKLIDLTHSFTADMPVFPGDPKATLEQVASIAKDSFTDHKLSTVMHVGTHMDAPLHMIEGGKKISDIAPERFFGQGVVIDVRGRDIIDSEVLDEASIESGAIVLLYTGFGDKYRTEEYFTDAPIIAEDFARKMVSLNVHMVGMDMSGPDADQPWLVHKILLTHDIYILENLANLNMLLDENSLEIIALPAKFAADGAPVRVVARI